MRNTARKTQVKNIFAQQPKINIPRSTFDRSNDRWHTFNVGELVPIYVDEVLPGDTFKAELNTFARLSTPLFPTMDSAYVDYHVFFVPNRLIWNNWQRFMGEQNDPNDSINFLVPVVNTLQILPEQWFKTNTIYDDMGYPTKLVGTSWNLPNNLAARAVNLVWNQWYRDQNFQQSKTVDLDDGPDNPNNYQTRPLRNKRSDYFTSALPTAQKFSTNGVPVFPQIPIISNNQAIQFSGISPNTNTNVNLRLNNGLDTTTWSANATGGSSAARFGSQTGLEGNMALNTVNVLRQAMQLQQFLETDNRGGTRYIELIRAHFNVINPDYRLQRPEFIYGKTVPLNITPVANTANSTGQLSGFGTTSSQNHFIKSFTEHGILLVFASARLNQSYQNSLDKMHMRSTRYDYYWPEFSHLGEQVIKKIEMQGDPSQPIAVNEAGWGWQERYAEYRYKNNLIANQFKSAAFITNGLGSLSAWHYAEELASPVTLNGTFISCAGQRTTMDRTLSVSSSVAPQIIHNTFIKLECTRPMPVHGIPQSLLRL